MAFQEKSALLMTMALVVVYGGYFTVVGRWMAVSPVDEIPFQPLMVAAVAPLVLLAIVGHVLIALVNPREAGVVDERDRLIGLRGEAVGGFVLAVGVFAGLVLAMGELHPFYIANALLLGWVLAEIATGGTKVFLYRRGT